MDGLAEWHFTDSAEVQLYENKTNAGRSTLTIGVRPLEREQKRLAAEGVETGPIESTKDFFLMRITDLSQEAQAHPFVLDREQAGSRRAPLNTAGIFRATDVRPRDFDHETLVRW
jgi:hypothetical protein